MPKGDAWPSFAFSPESDWGKCFRAFLLQKYEHSNSIYTLTDYRLILTRFFTEPPKSPESYTREDVLTFMHAPGRGKGRIGQMPSPGTRNGRLSVLSSFYQFAGGYSIVDEDGQSLPLMNRMSPTSGLTQVQSPRKYRSISFADFEKLFSVIPTDTVIGLKYRAIFLMYFWTARRAREITELRWRDLEQTTLIESSGTSRAGWLYHFRGKGKKHIDDIQEMPPIAATALFDYLQQSGKLEHGQPDDPIFTALPDYAGRGGYDPERPLSGAAIWYLCKHYAVLAGLDVKRISPHSFRHSAARARYENGEDIRSISALLRHSDIGVTDRYVRALTTTADPGYPLLEKDFGDM